MAEQKKSIQEQLSDAYRGQYQWKQILNSSSVGSKEYNNARDQYKTISDLIKTLEQADKKERDTKKANKGSQDRQKLVEALTRATDLQDADAIGKATKDLNDFDTANPKKTLSPSGSYNSELRYGPNGESLVPGTDAYKNGLTVPPSTTTSGKSGGSGKSSSSAGGTLNASTVDSKQLWVDYLSKTFKTIENPAQKMQIDNLFKQAKNAKWNEKTFMEALKGTDWWQNTLPSMRDFFIQSNDPRNKGTFAQKMINQTDYIKKQMESLGIGVRTIDPVTGKVIDNTSMINGIAMDSIKNGWSDAQVQEHLATNSSVIFTGGGAIGSYVEQLKQQALKYGVNLDKNQLDYMQRDLLNPSDGKDAQYYMNSIKQQAIDANPWFAPQLKEGRSLYEVTAPYRNQMATLLEVAPENITWNDLMNKVVNKDKNSIQTFADFTKTVKQDPLWQYTKNAKETYGNMAVDLMKQFGFMG